MPESRQYEEERRHAQERKKFMKDAFKEAIREYMDDSVRAFGKWSLRTLGIAVIVALLYFVLSINGWQHIPAASHARDIIK